MSKKSFIIILGLSVIVTYVLAIVEFLINTTIIRVGLPLEFTTLKLFSDSVTDYQFLLIDIIFWFVVLFGIWQLLAKVTKTKR